MAELRVETTGSVSTIVIDNPGRKNALTANMWEGFEPLLDKLTADRAVKVVIIAGAGGDFSAGADIRDLDRILLDPLAGNGGQVTAAEEAIARFAKPTIAAIQGYCVGGGWEIAGACDIRIASADATFGITPARLGIMYPLSGIERLVSIAGAAVAKYLLYSGDMISASTAYELGLVTRTVPQENFSAEVAALADRLAVRSQLSIQAMKQLVDIVAAGGDGLREANDDWQHELANTNESAIGVTAFLARESPAFTWSGPRPQGDRRL